jgi:hypothetical protein
MQCCDKCSVTIQLFNISSDIYKYPANPVHPCLKRLFKIIFNKDRQDTQDNIHLCSIVSQN